jgi:hypothetical protein
MSYSARLGLLCAVAVVAFGTAVAAQGANRLIASVGPGVTITLKTASGQRVRELKAGVYAMVVRDRSRLCNFHLSGPPGVAGRKTTGAFIGTTTWRVRLVRGRYVYWCDAHPSSMRGSFTVV